MITLEQITEEERVALVEAFEQGKPVVLRFGNSERSFRIFSCAFERANPVFDGYGRMVAHSGTRVNLELL